MTRFHYLYIEDDPLNCEVMQTLLNDVIGVASLTLFQDSHNVLERIKELHPLPDFVLLDMRVAPHDGYEMVKMLRGDHICQNLKILAVSAGIMLRNLEDYRKAGFDGVISKPVDMMTLPGIIRRLEDGEAIWESGSA